MEKNFIEKLIASASKQNSKIYDLELNEIEAGLFPGSSSITHGDCCPGASSGTPIPACYGGK